MKSMVIIKMSKLKLVLFIKDVTLAIKNQR